MDLTCTRSIFHTGYLVHRNSKGEARGRSGHKNNSKRVVRNLEERKVVTRGKNLVQGLTDTNAKVNFAVEVCNCSSYCIFTYFSRSFIGMLFGVWR